MSSRAVFLSSIIVIVLYPFVLHAGKVHPEQWYQEKWCRERGGRVEVVLPDKTRCDCLTDTHAVEFDFAKKWAEALGQSLYYGLQTGKKPGIVLILEDEGDYKYWLRLNSTIRHFNLPIRAWKMKP
jgi:hypothetical protein